MTSFIEVAKNVIKASWVFSPDFSDLLVSNYKTYNNHFNVLGSLKTADSSLWYASSVQPIYNYFNVVTLLNNTNTFMNTR